MLGRNSSFLLSLARHNLDKVLLSLPRGFRCSLNVVDRRHLIYLGSLELYKLSLEFLLTEWFDHALDALEIIRL